MKTRVVKTHWIALLLISAVGLGVAGAVIAGEHEDKPDVAPAPLAPGAEHKEIAKWAGEWTATMTFYMPGMEPITSKDKESGKMIMNGWFLQSDYDGNRQDGKGNVFPWSGRTLLGYNPHSKEYESTWISQLGPAISMHKGIKCPKGILHLYGSMPHYLTGKMAPTLMQRFPIDEAGAHRLEMHWLGEDKKPATKIMQIIYTKK